MEKTMSRILIETVVKTTLRDLKEDPERSIRKLIDMALHFSENQFQQDFFQAAQTMLKNENSPYYALVRNLISYADTDRLFQFGMNLGYNSCVCGAQQIRNSEKRLGYHIPWTVLFQMNAVSPDRLALYDAAISEGEGLGICTWMLFSPSVPEKTLDLIRAHPDSAFFLFCESTDLSSCLLDGLSELKNIMPVLRYREEHTEKYAKLQALGVPCCSYFPYTQADLSAICDGDLFVAIQQTQSVFTALLPQWECPDAARRQVQQAVEQARNEQLYQTIPWELERDNQRIDSIISGKTCTVCFDRSGRLLGWDGSPVHPAVNLFEHGLTGVLRLACLRQSSEVGVE